jgi:alpha-amylase/alpha-mannosidase (GH57 family)
MKRPVRVALLWHMHQPYYRNPFSGHYELPWLRLHAMKDYYGMARMLTDFPEVRVTFNLVPSMLLQLEGYLRGERDIFQDIFQRPAADLPPEETQFLVRHFFSVNTDHHIRPYERYFSLYRKKMDRLVSGPDPDWRTVFSIDELRDLQVWFQLTYFDEIYKANDLRVRSLIEKGARFDESDKLQLIEAEKEILERIVPEYRRLWEAGQIEISTTPFYHPILPLLLDPQAGRRANPHLPDYSLDFCWAEDARSHLSEALDYTEKLFGRRPAGMWPAEGSLSEAALELFEEAGVSWVAADEANLGKSLNIAFERDGQFNLRGADRLYRPYRWGERDIRLFFRDHYLSDLIGFYYQKFRPEEAAADMAHRLSEAGQAAGGSPLISIILDGENAWEFYPASGRPFLSELYRRLGRQSDLHTVTFSECLADDPGQIDHYMPGSWINGNFDIWIGDEEDRRGWTLLQSTREEWNKRRPALSPEVSAQCEQLLHIAEGSDWFWWYGKENFTPDIDIFDSLFRQNLQKVHQLLGQPVPNALLMPVHDSGRRGGIAVFPPQDYLQPEIDGEVSSYFEWLGAGRIDINSYGGAANIANPIVRTIYFGFSSSDFFLRIDTKKDASVYFHNGFALRVQLCGGKNAELEIDSGDSLVFHCRAKGARCAMSRIIEFSLPVKALDVHGGSQLDLGLEWSFKSQPFQSVPADRLIRLIVPTDRDYASNWQV